MQRSIVLMHLEPPLGQYVACERRQLPSHCTTQQCSRLSDGHCAADCPLHSPQVPSLNAAQPCSTALQCCSQRPFQLIVFRVSPALHHAPSAFAERQRLACLSVAQTVPQMRCIPSFCSLRTPATSSARSCCPSATALASQRIRSR